MKSLILFCLFALSLLFFTEASANSTLNVSENSAQTSEETTQGLSLKRLLLMPGKLTQAHAEYENQCEKCHVEFDKSNQNPLCLDCHKEVRFDIENDMGYHGIVKSIEQQHCRECHTDHKGRDFNIVSIDIDNFNHNQTDYPLEGKHSALACSQCHVSNNNKKFRMESFECIDCHKDDDVHQGQLGQECKDCHSPFGWKESSFDHDKTDFPLEYKHIDVPCTSCHVNNVYENTPQDCVSCHKVDDVHVGRFGNQCEECHSPKDWEESSFDHNTQTDFKLRYRHEEIACEACHTRPIEGYDMPQDCYSCHKKDDIHNGRNGQQCQDCHNERSWGKSQFNHDIDTDFKLLGSHKNLECEDCHTSGNLSDNLGRSCIDCHKNDDKHNGTLGEQCARCHNEVSWDNKIVFTHDLTRFPLLGMHKQVTCGECHLTEDFSEASEQCIDCHKKDDYHKGTLGDDCAMCHNPNDWGLWMFDHNRQTNFTLDGSHENRACFLCHTEQLDNPLQPSQKCYDCHKRDDAHEGSFGTNCQECHNTNSFKDNRMTGQRR
ncbi:MAG: cytochrome c3 family protein [Pseudomonadota bacterium]